MPQANNKDLKTIIQSKKEIRDISKQIEESEKRQKEYQEANRESSEALHKELVENKKKREDLLKVYKADYKAAKKGAGVWIDAANEWGDVMSNNVLKSIEEAEKAGKKLGQRFVIQSAAIKDIGVELNKSLNDGNEESVNLIEKLSGVNIQIEQMARGVTELSDDKMKELNEQAAEYLESLKKEGKVLGKDLELVEDLVKANKDNADKVSEAAKAGQGFAAHLTTAEGRANMLAVAISALGAAFEKVLDTAIKFQDSLGTSSKTSFKMAFSWNKLFQKMVGIGEPLADARLNLALAASDITMMGEAGKQLTRNMTWVARETGTSASNLAEMQEIMMLTTDLSREQAGLMIMGLEGFVKKAGGIPKEVFDDIATSAEEIAKFTDGSADAIARAATMANKLGINLKTAGTAADSLLNLESSIASEFEASVLIGRDLNLDKARQLALSNDLEGVMKEIVAQVGSEQEFLAMNAIERQALAEAVGMSTEDLSKMIGYGADGGGEVDPTLKLAKQSNKGIWEIVKQLTLGRMKGLVSMLVKGLVGLLGFKAMKTGIIAGLKTMNIDASKFGSAFTKSIKTGLKQSKIVQIFSKFKGSVTTFFKGPFGKVFGKLAIWLGVAIDLFRAVSKIFGIGSDKTGEERKTEKKQGFGILIGGIIGGALGAIGGPVGIGIGAGIGAWIGEKMATMKMPAGFAQAFKNWFAGVWGAVKPLVDRITALFSKFSNIFAGEGEMSEKIGKALGELLVALPGLIFEIAVSAVGLLIAGFMFLWDIIPKIDAFLGELVDSMVSHVWEATKDMGNAVWEGLKSGLASIRTAMYNFGEALFMTIKNALFGGINSVIESMKSFTFAGMSPFSNMELLEIADTSSSASTVNDFVWRSGQGIQKFSKDDNLLGMKDLSMLSQAGSGAASDARLEKQLAMLTAINENLAPLAALVVSNEGIKTAMENHKIVEST